jgi:hypothetical protein
MRNTADVTGGKRIAVLLQSISGANAINLIVAYYDIHGRKREVLFFYFVPDTTRDNKSGVIQNKKIVRNKTLLSYTFKSCFNLFISSLYVRNFQPANGYCTKPLSLRVSPHTSVFCKQCIGV